MTSEEKQVINEVAQWLASFKEPPMSEPWIDDLVSEAHSQAKKLRRLLTALTILIVCGCVLAIGIHTACGKPINRAVEGDHLSVFYFYDSKGRCIRKTGTAQYIMFHLMQDDKCN